MGQINQITVSILQFDWLIIYNFLPYFQHYSTIMNFFYSTISAEGLRANVAILNLSAHTNRRISLSDVYIINIWYILLLETPCSFVGPAVRPWRFLPPSNAHAHQSYLWACTLDFRGNFGFSMKFRIFDKKMKKN